jgi:hypothetical protein
VPDQQPLTDRDKAMAQAIVEALKPLLTEIERKLDRLAEKIDALLAHQRQARTRPADEPDDRKPRQRRESGLH